jgi:hypothetical protein
MKRHNRRQMKLADVIEMVAQYSRTDLEVGLVVADLINRGIVRVHTHNRPRKHKR